MTDQTTDRHVAEARRAVHESLTLLSAWEADRVRSLIADLESAVESRTAVRMADAASAVPLPPADQTTPLRDRIAEALRTTRRTGYEGKADHGTHRYDARCALCAGDVDALTDALAAAVLPAPADRATILREAADVLADLRAASEPEGGYTGGYDRGTRDALLVGETKLRRVADETATTETQAATLTPAERTMLGYALDQAQERIWSEDGFTDEDQAAVDSLRRLTAEQPAAGARQDGAQ
ncbi:hypothetical protein ACSLFT_28615 [Streptomyces sp. G6]|uniref:hypothetical protein n=1 Tax=Streptomyces sp. G6 TaxID=1178736 RepID=UPI003ED85C5B